MIRKVIVVAAAAVSIAMGSAGVAAAAPAPEPNPSDPPTADLEHLWFHEQCRYTLIDLNCLVHNIVVDGVMAELPAKVLGSVTTWSTDGFGGSLGS